MNSSVATESAAAATEAGQELMFKCNSLPPPAICTAGLHAYAGLHATKNKTTKVQRPNKMTAGIKEPYHHRSSSPHVAQKRGPDNLPLAQAPLSGDNPAQTISAESYFEG